MGIVQIVIVIFVLLVALYFIIKAFSKSNNLTKMADGKVLQTITAGSLKNTNNSSNFTYSMWIFIDDWNYMFGNKKTVLSRNAGPDVILGDKPNTLQVNIAYYASGDSATTPDGAGQTNCAANAANAKACQACNDGFQCGCAGCDAALYALTYNADGTPITPLTPPCSTSAVGSQNQTNTSDNISSCLIENIPIQKWVNVIVSLYGSTLDTYLDGKLVRTCVLPGVPKINNSADILVSPYGGFSGWTTTFKYWANASNPQEAYNIYKDGFGGSILGNMYNKYRARFSIVQNNKVTGSFEI
jgi:hypothetical protein